VKKENSVKVINTSNVDTNTKEVNSISVSASDVLSEMQNEVNVSAEDINLSTLAAIKYIPSINIAAGNSKIVVEKKLARPGEWFVNNITFGDTIEIIPITFRSRSNLFNKDSKSIVKSIIRFRDSGDLKNDKEWVEFTSQKIEGHEIQTGPELLFFMPKANLFCIFFSKKSVSFTGAELFQKGSGRLCQLKTRWHTATFKGKTNSWFKYDFSILPNGLESWPETFKTQGIKYDIPIDGSLLQNALMLFKSPTISNIEETDEESEDFAR
jgi:hypothetical protein